MNRTLLAALWLIPCAIVGLVFLVWVIGEVWAVIWRDAWWRRKRRKMVTENYVITLKPRVNRDTDGRPPKSRK